MDVNKELTPIRTRRGLLAAAGALLGLGAASAASAQEQPTVEVAGVQADPAESPEAQVAAPPALPEQAAEQAFLNARGFERVGQVARTNRGKEVSAYKVPGSKSHFEIQRPNAVANLVDARKPDKEGGEIVLVDPFEEMEWDEITFKSGPAIKLSTAVGAPLTFWKVGYVEEDGVQKLYMSPAPYGSSLETYTNASDAEKEFVQKELSTYIGEYLALEGDVNRSGGRIPEAFAMGHGSPNQPPAVKIVLS